jgi:signal transduction histidine kinase
MSEYGVGNGRGPATVAVVRDLSDRQRMLQIAAHRERLASVGEVTAQIMHGLSSPLTGIATLVQELLETCGDGERELLELVKSEAERAGTMVHELLYFTRRDASVPEVDLNEIVRRATELFKLRHRCAKGELQVELEGRPALVRGQPTQIEQVVVNLLDNASHATDGRKEPRISIRTQTGGERIVLEVSDNGAGIPVEIQERIFEPFFTTKAPGVGTGLGLAIVESTVRECDGTITVQSEPGRGATFTVAFKSAR